MRLVGERSYEQYGSVIFVKSGIPVCSTSVAAEDDIEVLTVHLNGEITITSLYKPPTQEFHLSPDVVSTCKNKIFIRDFNCIAINGGNQDTDKYEELLENWMDSHNLHLIHDPKLPLSFNS